MSNADRLEHLRSWANGWIHGGQFPGMLIGIYDDEGKEVFYHECTSQPLAKAAAEGKVDENGNDGVYRRDSIFRIYSMTKPLTGVAALILLERGLMKLEDPLYKFIPAFENMTVLKGGTIDNPEVEPALQHITILNILTHTSGLCYGIYPNDLCEQLLLLNLGVKSIFETSKMSLSEMCDRIAKSPLLYQPGSHFNYGFNLEVLGRVIEIVSGQTLADFFQKEIFDPLGMNDTGFYVPEVKRSRILPCYEATEQSSYALPKVPYTYVPSSMPANLSGGGGLQSTLADYAKFATFLLNDGMVNETTRLLKPETMMLMRRNHLPNGSTVDQLAVSSSFLEIAGGGYGFGLSVCTMVDPKAANGGARSSVLEFGWGGLASTYFFVDPTKRFSLILLSQLIPSSKYPYRAQIKWLSHWAMDAD